MQHGGEGAGSRVGWRAEARGSRPRAGAACWPKVLGSKGAGLAMARVSSGGLGGTMCMPRGRGRCPGPVARSQTREDHTTTPRWRATARIVLFSRGRLVSRIGQKKGKSTTCEPSMLQRSAWSRPPRRQRSASTSPPRRAGTVRRKWAV